MPEWLASKGVAADFLADLHIPIEQENIKRGRFAARVSILRKF
jgi:hypothetical protein